MTADRKIFISAAIYAILGLVAGLFGRTYTHSMGMEDSNHLSVLHTHILTLGFFFFLITLALEKLYTLSSQKKLFSAFFWVYSIGLAMTVVSMFAIGIIQANGSEESKALVGISGLGHILITAGIIIYTATINKALKTSPVKYSVENMPTVYKQKIISFVIVPMSGSPCDLELSNRDSTLQIGHV